MNSPASKEYSKETALLTTVHDLINAVTLPTATGSDVDFLEVFIKTTGPASYATISNFTNKIVHQP